MDLETIKKTLSDMCMPAKVYLSVSLVLTILTSLFHLSFLGTFLHVLIIGSMSFLLVVLCKQELTGVAWFILVFPLFMTLVSLYLYVQFKYDTPLVSKYLVYSRPTTADDLKNETESYTDYGKVDKVPKTKDQYIQMNVSQPLVDTDYKKSI